MKFEVLSSDLMSHLAAISRVLLSKNPMPILDNFRFEVSEEKLTVTASDGSTTMITSIAIQGVESTIALDALDGLVVDAFNGQRQWEVNGELVVNGQRGLPYLWELELGIYTAD